MRNTYNTWRKSTCLPKPWVISVTAHKSCVCVFVTDYWYYRMIMKTFASKMKQKVPFSTQKIPFQPEHRSANDHNAVIEMSTHLHGYGKSSTKKWRETWTEKYNVQIGKYSSSLVPTKSGNWGDEIKWLSGEAWVVENFWNSACDFLIHRRIQ